MRRFLLYVQSQSNNITLLADDLVYPVMEFPKKINTFADRLTAFHFEIILSALAFAISLLASYLLTELASS